MAEYFLRRSLGKTERLSPLFLYKTTRKLLGVCGDSGADLRTTLKAMVRFGVPQLRYWHSDVRNFDNDPEAHLYCLANEFSQLTYVRLDARHAAGSQTLDLVRAFLAAGFPVVFGFPVTSLVSEAVDISFRPEVESVLGGQAVVAVGYDDRRFQVTRGSLLIRNSWSPAWGEQGYGWLPYGFVIEKLAVDFWTVLEPRWLESGEFTRPQLPD
jgi:C1A family cysteine protease